MLQVLDASRDVVPESSSGGIEATAALAGSTLLGLIMAKLWANSVGFLPRTRRCYVCRTTSTPKAFTNAHITNKSVLPPRRPPKPPAAAAAAAVAASS